MRDIRFRAWDKENKEWVYSKPMPDMGFWKWVSYDSTTLFCEWTGLKDKNGKEIYEGDILKTETGRNKSVEWFDNGFYLEGVSHSQIDCEESEVIGNIYENPELLALSPERKQTEVGK